MKTKTSPLALTIPSDIRQWVLALFMAAFIGCGGSVDRPATGDNAVVLTASGATDGFTVGKSATLGLQASGGAQSYEWAYRFSPELDGRRFDCTQNGEFFSLDYDGKSTLAGFITITAKDGKNVNASYTAAVNYSTDGLRMETACGETCQMVAGTAKQIGFAALDGSGEYRWAADYSQGIQVDQFRFSGQGESASLIYDGGETGSGTITVRLTDSADHTVVSTVPLIYDPQGLAINASCGTDCEFIAGTPDQIGFSASGGSGGYIWTVAFEDAVRQSEFSFAGSGDSAVLVYDGGATGSGAVQVNLSDSAGAAKSRSVAVVGGNAYQGELSLSPDTVDVNGELVCQIRLSHTGSGPVAGVPVTFEIDEGPAHILDADGKPVTPYGQGRTVSTDGLGWASVRIQAGQTDATTEVRVRASWGDGGSGRFLTGGFTVQRGLGYLKLVPGGESPYPGHDFTVTHEHTSGAMPAGALRYELPFSVVHTDGNGNPLANQQVTLDIGNQTDSIQSVSLADETPLPATLTTDGDGTTDILLLATVAHGAIAENTQNLAIGGFILTATDANGLTGSYAVGFRVTTGDGMTEPLTITPPQAEISGGQRLGLNASGGTPPYQWALSGEGSLETDSGSGTVYIAPTPASSAVVIVSDANGQSASATLRPADTESPLSISPESARVSDGQRLGLDASGGTPPYRWRVSGSGSLSAISGSSTVYTASIPAGSAVVILRDAKGASVSADISPRDEGEGLTINASAFRLTVGVPDSILFEVTGGAGGYQWTTHYGSGLNASAFSVQSANNSATLIYDGGATPDGAITLTVTDQRGDSASFIVAVIASVSGASLEIIPDEVDAGGEVVCRYQQQAKADSGAPAAGIGVTFRILQGPAYFIDGNGDPVGQETDGTDQTDANGYAFARIRAGESPDLTHVVVEARSEDGAVAMETFTISRNQGVIDFESDGPSVWEHRGDLEPGTIYWALPVVMTHTDGSGEPLANEAVTIESYLPTASIAAISLGEDPPLPATLMTDDDGRSEFVLEVAVDHGFIPEETGPVSIGSLVLTGQTSRDVRGSLALVFGVRTVAVADPLAVSPESIEVTNGQIAGFSVTGGSPPYSWALTGAGELLGPSDESSVIYQASVPAGTATLIVYDADGDSVAVNITVKQGP